MSCHPQNQSVAPECGRVLGSYEALLFDMDGTLLNSRAAVDRAWTAWAERMGLPVGDVITYIHGRTALDTMQHFLPNHSDLSAELSWLNDREQGDLEGITEIPGAGAFLQSLPTHRWAVVTSATRQLALKRIAAAGLQMPPLLVTPEDVSRGKPDPEGYLRAAHLLSARPENCLVFEDTHAGISAGLAAGAQVVQVVGTETPSPLPVRLMVDGFRKLTSVIEGGRMSIRTSA